MATESDTTTVGRTGPSTALSAPISRGATSKRLLATRLAAARGECEGFVSDITSGPAEFADSASDALEKAGELADGISVPKPPSIVARAAKFLGDVWSAAPSLCDDAAQPVSEKEYYRGVVVGAFDAIFDTQLKKILETVTSLADLQSKVQALAQDTIARMGNIGNTSYQASEAPATTGLAGTTTAQAVSSLDTNKTSVPALSGCINGVSVPVVTYASDGTTQSFRYRDEWTNGCGVDVNVLYCTVIMPGQCVPNNFKALTVGASFSRLGRETVNDTTLIVEGTRFVICPDKFNGQTVYPDGRSNPACYVYNK